MSQKIEFGAIFDKAVLDGAIVITKHDAPKAVLLSADFEAPVRSRSPPLSNLRPLAAA